MPFDIITKFGKRKRVDIPEDYDKGVPARVGEIEIPAELEEKIDLSEAVDRVIKSRRSVRKYSKRNVDGNLIMKILEAGTYAPSCGNYQPWEFIIVKHPEVKAHLVEACFNQNWMLDAPVFIVACINERLAGAIYGERGLKLYGIQGVAAAIENIILSAESLGLSTCWVGAFSEIMVARILECPEYVRPSAIITVGYSDEKSRAPARQSIKEFVHVEKFGNTLLLELVKKERKRTYMKFR